MVTITFDLNRNIDVAAQDMRDAWPSVIRLLPRDAKPPLIKKLDTDASPVMTLVLSARQDAARAVRNRRPRVKDSIESVGGVGQVEIVGGQKRAVNVWVDADRLAAYKIPILAGARCGRAAELRYPRRARRRGIARTGAAHAGPFPRSEAVQRSGRGDDRNSAPVRIRDIGYAEDGHKEQRTAARYDGGPPSRSRCGASPARTRSR